MIKRGSGLPSAAAVVGCALVLMLTPTAPASAHGEEGQRIWYESWEAMVHTSGLSPDLLAEWKDFRDRHTPKVSQTSQSASSFVSEGSEERWRPLVETYFPPEAVETMMCLMHHESRGDPTAENPRSSATGLFQIMHSIWGPHFGVTSRSGWHDPATNVASAAEIYGIQGYQAWSPYNRGLCR